MKKIVIFAALMFSLAQMSTYGQDSTADASNESVEVKDTSVSTPDLNEQLMNLQGAVDGMNEILLDTKSTVDGLKKIKISGYVQSQFQAIEKDGAASVSGGSFGANQKNRFTVRRGRIKFNYDNDLTQYCVQLDVNEGGFAGIKDAWGSIKDPWIKTFGFTMGVFDRPFGYEVGYSSSSMEYPERARSIQQLFPGEQDLGARLDITPQEGLLSHFNFKGGIFAGNGVAKETDNNKDFIGRLGYSFPFAEENLSIEGGASAYIGKSRIQDGKTAYEMSNGDFVPLSGASRDLDRKFFGADLQLYYDAPVIGGFSLKGEYVAGKQPGTATSNDVYNKTNAGDLYTRKSSGYYVSYVQNIGMDNQFVLKYDVFDPNTDVTGSEITGVPGSKLSAADLKYSTLGVGWVYHFDGNVKFTVYYEMVKNETANATGALSTYNSDLKDNVLTFRMQYKF